MSPEQKVVRLADIAESIEAARRLVEVANMATEDVHGEQGDACRNCFGRSSTG